MNWLLLSLILYIYIFFFIPNVALPFLNLPTMHLSYWVTSLEALHQMTPEAPKGFTWLYSHLQCVQMCKIGGVPLLVQKCIPNFKGLDEKSLTQREKQKTKNCNSLRTNISKHYTGELSFKMVYNSELKSCKIPVKSNLIFVTIYIRF